MNRLDDLVSDLSQLFASAMEEALQHLLKSGFELPLYIVAISANGSMVFLQYAKNTGSAGEEPEIETLSSRDRHEGYVLPINIIFFDSKGEAARLFIQTPDKYKFSSFSTQGVRSVGGPPRSAGFSVNNEGEKSKAVQEIKNTKCPKCGRDLAWVYYCDLCGWYDEEEAKNMGHRSKTGASRHQIMKHLVIEAQASRRLLAAGVLPERFSSIMEDMGKAGEIESMLKEIQEKNLFIEDNQLIEEGTASVVEEVLKRMSN